MPRPKAGAPPGSPPRNSTRRASHAASASSASSDASVPAFSSADGARPRAPRPAPRSVPSRLSSAQPGDSDPERFGLSAAPRPTFYPEPDEFDADVPPLLPARRAFLDAPPPTAASPAPSTSTNLTSRSPSEPRSWATAPRSSETRSAEARSAASARKAARPEASASSSSSSSKREGRGSGSSSSSKGGRRGLPFEVAGVVALAVGAMLAWNACRPEPQGWLPLHALWVLRTLFGIGAYVVPLLSCAVGVLLIAQRQSLPAFGRGAAISLLILLSGVHLGVPTDQEFSPDFLASRGGLVGAAVAFVLRRALGQAGAAIGLLALAVVALLLLTEVSLSEIAGRISSSLGSSSLGSSSLGRASDSQSEKPGGLKGKLRGWLSSLAARHQPEDEEDEEEKPEPALRARRSPSRPQVLEEDDDDEPNAFDARLLARAEHAARVRERERRSPFFPQEEIGAHGQPTPQPAALDFAPNAGEPSSGEPPAAEAFAEPIDRLQSVRVEIDLAPPPASVLEAPAPPAQVPLQVLEAERDASLVPINAPDDGLTPAEALEAQAAASAREEDAPASPRRRPAGFRRTFGDGPPMPEYFDAAVRALDPPIVPDLAGVEEDIRESITTVEDTLLSFKVDARVTDVKRGPVITRYEVQPASGVRVAAIANLDRDLARALSAHAVRIEAPVPGKNVVGIEIPNKKVHLVRLRDVLELPEFLSAPSKLSFVLGKDIAGQPKWADLTKMPHMLVAGATNSGKSVCLNAIISSIIARASPDEVKFSLIDPKRVELTLYRDIPHLYHPVVVEPKDAVKVLRGMIVEMDRRYKKFAEAGVRNISSYNQKLDEDEMPLPYIVIVIDELADLMMTAAAEFEKLICRLAQLARATGIHLIVATQRPSVNVITGVIKANIPARVAFAVASQVDSRTILDAVGAERLIGSGDMLFDANNGGKAVRIQGAYLSEDEVNRIVQVAKGAYREEPREYGLDLNALMEDGEDAEDKPPSTSRAMPDDRRDEMYDEVREFILRHQEVSASMIQRKYEIGFPRAARIVDQFERDGLLGPADGPKPRKVLGQGA